MTLVRRVSVVAFVFSTPLIMVESTEVHQLNVEWEALFMAYCMFSPFIPYFACSLPMIGFQNITRDTAVIDIPDNTTKESQLGTSESRDENSFDEIIESQGIHGERSIMIAILQLHTSRVTFPVRVCLSSAAANTQHESCLSAEGPYSSICFLLM